MLFSKPSLFVLLSTLLTANADTIRGVQQRDLEATATVNLGAAGNYAILASSGISTVPPSAITGDIAVSPIAGAAMTGFSFTFPTGANGEYSESTQVTGKAYASDYLAPTPSDLIAAAFDMSAAYEDAATERKGATLNLGDGEIGSKTLRTGVYQFSTGVSVSTDLTFEGSDTDVFIIQMTGVLSVAANVKVILAGGAQAKNIFWQVAGTVAVKAGAHMEGILLVKTEVTFITGSSLNGRVFSQTRCDLQQATINSI